MAAFDPQAYGPIFAPLLESDRRRPLDAGSPNSAALSLLKQLSANSAFAHVQSNAGNFQPANADMAACCMSGVWLLHDCLDESHKISQDIGTPSGTFWHAIMHRREGDHWNSKYWFRRVGEHPAFDVIGERASEMAAQRGQEQILKKLTAGGTWDPCAFVDLCESCISRSSDARELCLDIQQSEWEALFDHCYRETVGK